MTFLRFRPRRWRPSWKRVNQKWSSVLWRRLSWIMALSEVEPARRPAEVCLAELRRDHQRHARPRAKSSPRRLRSDHARRARLRVMSAYLAQDLTQSIERRMAAFRCLRRRDLAPSQPCGRPHAGTSEKAGELRVGYRAARAQCVSHAARAAHRGSIGAMRRCPPCSPGARSSIRLCATRSLSEKAYAHVALASSSFSRALTRELFTICRFEVVPITAARCPECAAPVDRRCRG